MLSPTTLQPSPGAAGALLVHRTQGRHPGEAPQKPGLRVPVDGGKSGRERETPTGWWRRASVGRISPRRRRRPSRWGFLGQGNRPSRGTRDVCGGDVLREAKPPRAAGQQLMERVDWMSPALSPAAPGSPQRLPRPSPRTAKGAGQQCGFRGTPSPVPSCAGPAVGTVPQRK